MSSKSGDPQTLERKLDAVRQVSADFAATLNIDELLAKLMVRISGIMNCERSTLFLVDAERNELWSKFFQGEEERTVRIPLARGIAGEVARTGRSIIVDDAHAHPSFLPDIDRLTGFCTRTLLTVPLKSPEKELTGVVQVLNRQDGKPFGEEDRELLEFLSPHIALVLRTSWLYTSAVRHNRELDIIKEIERELRRIKDPDLILGNLLAKAIEALDCEAGSILLREDENLGKLYFRTAIGEKSEALNGYTIGLDQGIAGWVVRNGKAARVNDVSSDGRYDPSLAEIIGFETRQILAVPLKTEERVIGAVEVLNRTTGTPFTVESVRFLEFISLRIVKAIESARKARERDRRERLATIGNMLSGVIHDLKTPITVISSCADYLGGELEEDRRKALVERIAHQLSVIEDMIEELLSFARGERRIFIRKVFMHSFLDDLEQLVRAETEGYPVEVIWRRDYEGDAFFDAGNIRRALVNICRNAVEAMPEGGKLKISVSRSGDNIIFSIADNGPGIPAEVSRSLFAPFVTSGKKGGTGLGLAIAHQAVEDHGGTIEVETGRGRGTTFSVALPLGDMKGRARKGDAGRR
jgi:signal transduction histidine kinase